MPVSPLHEANCAEIVRLFDGREAIYDENGFWRVRVSNLRANAAARIISADVEEIPTPALDIFRRGARGDVPQRWEIDSTFLTEFSHDYLSAGVPMICWSMWFGDSLVEEVVRLAETFPPDLPRAHRYLEIVLRIRQRPGAARPVRVFPDAV